MDPITWWTQELLRLAKVKARAVARRDRAAVAILEARMGVLVTTIQRMAGMA